MKTLSISTAWTESLTFVKREAGLLFPIAFLLIALPMAFLQTVAPPVAPGQQPAPGAWMFLIIPLALLSIIGSLTITALALGRETVVRDAFGHAFRRLLPMLGAMLLIGVLAVAVMLPLVIIMTLLIQDQERVSLFSLVLLGLIFSWVSIRLMLLTPVGVAEPLGPIAILKRSWAITAGHFWRLLGVFFGLLVLLLVVTLAVTTVGGIIIYFIAGKPEPGGVAFVLTLLLGGVVSMIFAVLFATIFARIYVQLADQPSRGT